MSLGLMLQGTGSDVGKSILVAGLCRALSKRGMIVRSFKPQNMSNNAAVTEEGGEIGRAQALQALACGIEPTIHMNPVLLKPQSDVGAQIIVHGKRIGLGTASYYLENKSELLTKVIESYEHLKKQADIVIIEGAGSPAEVNLRAGDIANMGFAEATNTPVILIGDIDRGGVIASIIGTHKLLSKSEQELIQGYIINKFRGDISLFDAAHDTIIKHTGWKNCGVLPFVPEVKKLPAEDAVVLDHFVSNSHQKITIAVPMLSRIANFDDLDPLIQESDVDVNFISPGKPIPASTHLIIIPGTKATLADLGFLKKQGWDIDIAAHIRRKGNVLGICGGYQMLGKKISDPEGIEGKDDHQEALGYLNIETIMQNEKTPRKTTAYAPHLNCETEGYEIHIGKTTGPDTVRPFLENDKNLGAMSENGQIAGVYVHGLFVNDKFRAKFLSQFRNGKYQETAYSQEVENALDTLAEKMEYHLDIDAMLAFAKST